MKIQETYDTILGSEKSKLILEKLKTRYILLTTIKSKKSYTYVKLDYLKT